MVVVRNKSSHHMDIPSVAQSKNRNRTNRWILVWAFTICATQVKSTSFPSEAVI